MTTQMLDAVDDQPEAAVAVAEEMVRDLLHESARLRGFDKVMYPPNPSEDARRRSRLMFDAWRQWIGDADALMRRIAAMRREGRAVEGDEQLYDELGHAQCVVRMTLEQVERARAQVQRGETISAKELRSELQLPNRR